MVCAVASLENISPLAGGVAPLDDTPALRFGCGAPSRHSWELPQHGELAETGDPFEDFDEDDFDDDFDDDFEEDWEDDLTEDEEFPDTFGGSDDEPGDADEVEDPEESPFADDPDFDDA